MAVASIRVVYTRGAAPELPAARVLVDESSVPFGTTGNPIKTSPASANPAAIYTDQQAVTASAVALTSQALTNGLVIKAKDTNAGNVFVGGATVNTTDDGSGNGYRLKPGESIAFGVTNANAIYIIGTASDVVYVAGN